MNAKPFVKAAGGKRQLLPELLKHAPKKFGTYHEPFVGGGALFFTLAPKDAVLIDNNARLIHTYRAVRESVADVIKRLRRYEANFKNFGEKFFYAQRIRPIDDEPSVEIAAWYIFLNKTCFNGLYRVNKDGRFNVPIGRYANPTIVDVETLEAASKALNGVSVIHGDFMSSRTHTPVPGDFVYFDPPYAPVSDTANFVAYTKEGFGVEDQKRLRDYALTCKNKGVHVMLTNAAVPLVEELYSNHFTLTRVEARRSVNSVAGKRGSVGEYIIT